MEKMMDIREVYQMSQKLKKRLSALMDALTEKQSRAGLPPAGETYDRARAGLDRREYDIVVCGEVKQGKSSFINALLGAEILPVAEEVATSQVFRISSAEKESFFLVFADGTRVPLKDRSDLIRYGSEIPAKLEKDPLIMGRKLDWIEVNTPATFLPPGIHLLDTPGLGALYCSHAEITHRYVAAADAVIFLKSAIP